MTIKLLYLLPSTELNMSSLFGSGNYQATIRTHPWCPLQNTFPSVRENWTVKLYEPLDFFPAPTPECYHGAQKEKQESTQTLSHPAKTLCLWIFTSCFIFETCWVFSPLLPVFSHLYWLSHVSHLCRMSLTCVLFCSSKAVQQSWGRFLNFLSITHRDPRREKRAPTLQGQLVSNQTHKIHMSNPNTKASPRGVSFAAPLQPPPHVCMGLQRLQSCCDHNTAGRCTALTLTGQFIWWGDCMANAESALRFIRVLRRWETESVHTYRGRETCIIF